MGECPICEVHRADPVSQDTCDCGYGIEKKEIVDKSKLQNWINSLERNGKWAKVVKVKESVHEAQKKKYSRWSIDDTAALLGESKSNTSDDLGLAKALAVHPELAVQGMSVNDLSHMLEKKTC